MAEKGANTFWTGDENDLRGWQFSTLFPGATPALMPAATDPVVLILDNPANYADGKNYYADFVQKISSKKSALDGSKGFPLKADTIPKFAAAISATGEVEKENNYFDMVDVNANGLPKRVGDEITYDALKSNDVDTILAVADLKVEIIPSAKLAEILKAKGFNQIPTIGENGRTVARFEDFEDWKARLTGPLPANHELNLKKVSNYYNRHPELRVASAPAVPFVSRLGLWKRPASLAPSVGVTDMEYMKQQKKIINTYAQNAREQTALKQFQQMPLFPYHHSGGDQRGGDGSTLKKIYDTLCAQLKMKGQGLAPEDKKVIEEKLKAIDDYERGMRRLLSDLGVYNRLSTAFTGTSNGDITLGMVQKATEKFKACLAKYNRHETAMLGVMSQICVSL